MHGLHIVGTHKAGGIVALGLAANRVEIADIATQRVEFGDLADKGIGDAHASNVTHVVAHAGVAALEGAAVGADEGIAAVAHLDDEVIVARRQVRDVDGVKEDIHFAHIETLVEEKVLHTRRRFTGLDVIIDEELAFLIKFVAVVDFGIEVQLVGLGPIEGIHPGQEVHAALGAT